MADLPIFNYLPLEKLHAFISKIDSDEAKELLSGLLGQEGCCWGNPCYYKGCLACFCRGNIKFLTAPQAYVQGGMPISLSQKLSAEMVEYEDRKAILRDQNLTQEALTPYREHFDDYFFEGLPIK